MLPSFKRLRTGKTVPATCAGSGGPVKVRRQKGLTAAAGHLHRGAGRDRGRREDRRLRRQVPGEGAAVFQQNASGGLRYSSSIGYLDHHGLPNLTIITRALITRW